MDITTGGGRDHLSARAASGLQQVAISSKCLMPEMDAALALQRRDSSMYLTVMTDCSFHIGAEGIDTEKLVEEIRTTVTQKAERGAYADPRVARAERTNLKNLANGGGFLDSYLECLHDAVFVDISDFQIQERRNVLSKPLILLKKLIWKLLKFYTYRLWSQQNEINGLLLSATETIDDKYRDKIIALEKRIATLEGRDREEDTA